MHVNRQIGDYVVSSEKENEAPFWVHHVDGLPISSHQSVTDAVRQIAVYQAADKRRKRT